MFFTACRFFQDIAVLVSVNSIHFDHIYYGGVFGALSCDMLRAVFHAPQEWKIILILAAEAATFVLPAMAARGIYLRSRRGFWLAYASAAACAAVFAATLIAIDGVKLLNLAPHAVFFFVIPAFAQYGKEYAL